MTIPTLAKAHEIDILVETTPGSGIYEIVCGITSQDFKMSRPPRETKTRDCGVDFAKPIMQREPGAIEDCTFSGSGKLDVDYRARFKTLWQSETPSKFKLAVKDFGTFVAEFVMTEFGVTSDALDEAGYIEVALTLMLNGTVTWTNE